LHECDLRHECYSVISEEIIKDFSSCYCFVALCVSRRVACGWWTNILQRSAANYFCICAGVFLNIILLFVYLLSVWFGTRSWS